MFFSPFRTFPMNEPRRAYRFAPSLLVATLATLSLLGAGCADPNSNSSQRRAFSDALGTGLTPSRNLVAEAATSDFHIYVRTVADGGDDSAAGTQGAPFATLHRAATFVRQNPGQTAVYVAAGEYSTNSQFNSLRFFITDLNIDHSVILLGGYDPINWATRDIEMHQTVIRDSSTTAWFKSAIEFDDNIDVGMDGFTIAGGSGDYPFGVEISGFGTVTLSNNRIFGSQSGPRGVGVYIDNSWGVSGNITVENNTIVGSTITALGLNDSAQAIYNGGGGSVVLIKGNVLIGREAGDGLGQDTAVSTSSGRIEANRIIGNTAQATISVGIVANTNNIHPGEVINNLIWSGNASYHAYAIQIHNASQPLHIYHNSVIAGQAGHSYGLYSPNDEPPLRMLNNAISSLANPGQDSVGLELQGYSNIDLIANNIFDPTLDHAAIGTNLCPGFIDDPDSDSSTCTVDQFNDLPGFEALVNDNLSYTMSYADADGVDDVVSTIVDNDLSLPSRAPCTITGGGFDLTGVVDEDFAGNARTSPRAIGAFEYVDAELCTSELELLPPAVASLSFPTPVGNTFVDTIIPSASIEIHFNKPMNEASLTYGPDLAAQNHQVFYLGSTTTLVPDPNWTAGSFELVINGEDTFGQAMSEYRVTIHVIDGVIYVRRNTHGGDNNHPGTAEQPKANIQGALSKARELGLDLVDNHYLSELRINVAGGNYKVNSENGSGIMLMPGISIYGGYDPTDWNVHDPDVFVTQVKDIAESVTGRIAATFELEPAGSRSVPVLNSLTIFGGDSPSVAGVLATQSGLTINHCIIYGTKKAPSQRAVGIQMGVEGSSNRYTLDLANSTVIGSLNNPLPEAIGVWALSDANTNIRKSIIKGSDAGSTALAIGVQMAAGVLHRNRVQGDSQGGSVVKGLVLGGAISSRPWVANNIIYSGNGVAGIFGIELLTGGNGADIFNNHVFADSTSGTPTGIRVRNQPNGTIQLVNNAVSSSTNGSARGIWFNQPAGFQKFRNNVVKSGVPNRYYSTPACGGTCTRTQLDALGFIKLWAGSFDARDADGPDNNLQTIEDNNHRFVDGASCKIADWGLNESSVGVDFYYNSRTIYSVGAIEYISPVPCTL